MNFKNFVGNEKIKDKISYLAQSNRLSHAVIIEGDEGLGKRTLARNIAQALVCRSSDGERPCGVCAQCSKAKKGIHPDIFEYAAEGGAGSFHIDTVRRVIDDVYVKPNESDYKIYILANCQCMNISAQNALLKVLEEPPEYAVFLLTVTNKSALLETVLSRSVVFTVEGVDISQGAEYICRNFSDVEYSDAYNAVSVWSGNIGRAVQTIGDGKLSEISDAADVICRAVIADSEYELIKSASVFEKNKQMLIGTLSLMKTVFRDALFYPDSDLLSGKLQTVKMLNSRLSQGKLLRLVETCDNMRIFAEKNGNNAILVTKLCYELRRAINR